MGFLDKAVTKAKDTVSKNSGKIQSSIDKAETVANRKTGGKYSDKISKAANRTGQAVDKVGGEQAGSEQAGSEQAGPHGPNDQTGPNGSSGTGGSTGPSGTGGATGTGSSTGPSGPSGTGGPSGSTGTGGSTEDERRTGA